MATLRGEIKHLIEKEEDVLTYALFPQIAKKFFENRLSKKTSIDFQILEENNGETYPI